MRKAPGIPSSASEPSGSGRLWRVARVARIRTLKPEFFHHRALAACSPRARLLFAALMQLADREGRLRWIAMQIHAHAFPYEPGVDVDALAAELEEIGSIRGYVVGADRFVVLPSFNVHQRVKANEPASRLPSPDGALCAPPRLPLCAAEVPKGSIGTGTGNREQGIGNRESSERTRAMGSTQTGSAQTDTTRRWTIYDLRSHLGDTRPAPPALQAPQWVGIFEHHDDDEIDAALKLCVSKAYPLAYFLALFDGDGKRKAPRTPARAPVEDVPRPYRVPRKWAQGLPGGALWTMTIDGWPEDERREYAKRCKDGEDRIAAYVEIDDRTTA